MKNSTLNIFEELFIRYPALSVCRGEILKAYEIIESVYAAGGKLLVCGNGGSGADTAGNVAAAVLDAIVNGY